MKIAGKFYPVKLSGLKKLMVAFVLVVGVSCQNKETSKGNTFGKEAKLKFNEVSIAIDSVTLSTYSMMSATEDSRGHELIYGYNYKVHALDQIDLANHSLTHIRLSKEGANGIPPYVNGMYVHNPDSIWLYNSNIFYLVNGNGNITSKYTIPSNAAATIITQTNFSISTLNIYYHPERKSIFYTTTENKEFIENEFFLGSNKIKKYKLEKSKLLNGEPALYGWKQLPNVSYNHNLIIYNYPVESKIYTLDINSGIRRVMEAKSKNTSNISEQLKGRAGYDNMERHKIENIHFFEIVYNQKYNCYFRIHLDKAEYNSKEDIFKKYLKKDMYLMVFDKDFRIINETKMTSNKYYYLNGWFSTKQGLAILHRESGVYDPAHENIKFDIIAPRNAKSILLASISVACKICLLYNQEQAGNFLHQLKIENQ
jgi:hypothetical protein